MAGSKKQREEKASKFLSLRMPASTHAMVKDLADMTSLSINGTIIQMCEAAGQIINSGDDTIPNFLWMAKMLKERPTGTFKKR
jgi:hypothetical protein